MLEISLLGEITFRLPGEPLNRIEGQKEIALLAYLAHTGQAHGREALTDLFWDASSTKQGLSNLRTVLTRLRKQVGDYLIITRKTLAVIPAVHEQTDSVRFQTMVTRASHEPPHMETSLLEQGLALYRGEFMHGLYLPSAPRFNDWLQIERERLYQVAMNGYRQLAARQEEQGTFGAAILTAQQWLRWDPLDESARQQLMRLLVSDGRVTEALQIYEKYRQLLEAELGIPPAPAITALYQAIQDGSQTPLEIVATPLHNLPRTLAPLYGRQHEIERLTGLLLDADYPVLSIIGPGGMGKTTLALAAGRHLIKEDRHPFADGIWFVPLEEVDSDDPAIVREEVAALLGQALGTSFHSASDLWQQILRQLAGKNLLIILDNIEQFSTAASDLIAELLGASDGLHLLITSRSMLTLGSSFPFPLAGLDTPDHVSADALNNDSVRLFAERASRIPIRFHLEEHLAEVVAICRFVEGMPLGIELAAAALGNLTIDEIMPALSTSLRLLESDDLDRPLRQRSLHALFETSWQLLDPLEQTLLAQISVFQGGFTRQAAVAVSGDRASGLFSLQHHALLTRDEKGRFRMHPLLRQLAREKLSAPTMVAVERQALNRHSIYFGEFMAASAEALQRGDGREALQAIQPEQANLRAAWQFAIRNGRWSVIGNCLEGTHLFFQRKGFFTEEATLLDAAIAALQPAMTAKDALLIGLLSRLLTARAWCHYYLSQFAEGLQIAEQACEVATQLRNPGLEARARLAWANLLARKRQHKEALNQFEQAVSLAKVAQDPIAEADGWIGIGAQMLWQPELEPAWEPLRLALKLCRSLHYTIGELSALILMGDLAQRQGRYAESIAYDRQALHICRSADHAVAEAEVLGSMGVGHSMLFELAAAKQALMKALASFRQLNMTESEGWMLGQLGYVEIKLGDYSNAESTLAGALNIARQLKDEFWQAWVKLRLAEMWVEREAAGKAMTLITEAVETAETVNNPRFLAAVYFQWGTALLEQSRWADSERKFRKAFDLWLESGKLESTDRSLSGLAYAAYRQNKPEATATYAEQLWRMWQESPAAAQSADLKLYWMLGVVWSGLGDSRARDVWKAAYALLQERAGRIPDTQARKLFLEQVRVHRAIVEIAEQL